MKKFEEWIQLAGTTLALVATVIQICKDWPW